MTPIRTPFKDTIHVGSRAKGGAKGETHRPGEEERARCAVSRFRRVRQGVLHTSKGPHAELVLPAKNRRD